LLQVFFISTLSLSNFKIADFSAINLPFKVTNPFFSPLITFPLAIIATAVIAEPKFIEPNWTSTSNLLFESLKYLKVPTTFTSNQFPFLSCNQTSPLPPLLLLTTVLLLATTGLLTITCFFATTCFFAISFFLCCFFGWINFFNLFSIFVSVFLTSFFLIFSVLNFELQLL